MSFFSGVYSPSIGFTLAIGSNAKQLVGMSGILIGVGEVLGGATFGILGKKTNRWGRDPIVIMGFVLHMVAFFLIFLNLPNDAPFGDTQETSVFDPPRVWIALLCSFLLGFGDSCYNTQIYSLLGGVFASKSADAFAIFKFTQVRVDFVLFLHGFTLKSYPKSTFSQSLPLQLSSIPQLSDSGHKCQL